MSHMLDMKAPCWAYRSDQSERDAASPFDGCGSSSEFRGQRVSPEIQVSDCEAR